MSKIVDYRRNGPGVRKTGHRDYNMSDFWRTYFAKFFKLLGLNAMYFVAFGLIVLACYFPLNSVLGTSNALVDKLASYELNSEYTSVVKSYVEAYKLDDATLSASVPAFQTALDRIERVNHDLLKDGSSAFNFSAWSEEEKIALFDELKAAFAVLDFTLEPGEEDGVIVLKDNADQTVMTCTVSKDGIDFADTLPRSLMDLVKVILCLAPVILLSPVHLMMFRVTKDYVQGNPSFMFSDMWDTLKKNWWQSLVLGVLTYLAFAVVGVSLMWYWSFFYSSWLFRIGFVLCLVLAYVVVSMSFYVGIMQVSLDMNLRKVIKNAFYFSVICLWRNLFMILVTVLWFLLFFFAYIFGMAYPVIMSLTFTFLIIAFFSFWFYFISYMTYPSLLKYIVDPYYAALKEKEAEKKEQAAEEDAPDEEPEYVYHNGRMVHRSVLEQEQLFNDDTKE